MSRYLVESPHTREECLQTLDELAKMPEDLKKFEFGCKVDDHRGFAILEASSASAAKNIVPGFLRNKAKAVELTKFSLKEIESFHK